MPTAIKPVTAEPVKSESWLNPKPLHDWLAEPDPPVQWLIQDLLPAESLVMISGPRKRAFKTWLAMWLSGMVSGGVGYDVWKTDGAANLLFIEEEGTSWGTKNRMRKVGMGLGVDVTVATAANFWMAHRTGFKLDNPKMVSDLCAFIRANNIKLVVLDALTYMHRGDPNSERDMQTVVLALFDLRAAGATVCWLSHTNKEGDKVDHDPDLDVRGSSVILDAYDAHIAVRRKKKGTLSVTGRFKEAEEQEWEFYWNFPPKDVMGPVKLEIINVTAEKRQGDIVERLLDSGWQPGVEYDAAAFRQALGGLSSGQAATLRAELVQKQLLKLSANGKFVYIPVGVVKSGAKINSPGGLDKT